MDKIKNKSKTYKKASGGSFFTPMGKPDTRPLQAPTLNPEAQIGPGKMPIPLRPEMVKPNTLPPQAQIASPVSDGRKPFGVGGPLPQDYGVVRPNTLPPQAQFKKGGRVASKPKGVGVALRGFGKAMKGGK